MGMGRESIAGEEGKKGRKEEGKKEGRKERKEGRLVSHLSIPD